MKAQGLSMQTIVVIIIAIIVLAGVVVFFFMYQGKTKSLMGQQTSYSGSKVNCATLQSCVYKKDISSCSGIASDSECSGYIPSSGSCTIYDSNGDECTCTGGSCS